MDALISRLRDNRFTIPFAIIAIWIIADFPFFGSFLPINDGHDTVFHLYRIEGISQALINGQFPVRMQTSQLSGYGYPVSIMYGDIFLYPIAILHILGLSINTGYRIFVLFLNLLTLVSTYCIGKKVFHSRSIGFAVTALWTLSPYRLEDIFLRGAVGEYTALFFVPLLAYGIYLVFQNNNQIFAPSVWTALGCAGIILSHVLSVILVAIPCIFFVIFGLIKNHSSVVIKRILLSMAMILSTTAWFLIPFFNYYRTVEMKVANSSSLGKQTFAAGHATQVSQLFEFAPPLSGGSSADQSIAGEMPFALGWGLFAGISIWLIAMLCRQSKKIDDTQRLSLITATVLLIVLFLSTNLFHWGPTRFSLINKAIGLVATIQFPWRFLGSASFLAILLYGLGLFLLQCDKGMRTASITSISMVTLLAFFECGISLTSFINSSNPTPRFDSISYYETYNNSGVMSGEYLPVNTDPSKLMANSAKYPETHNAEICNYRKTGTTISFDISSQSSYGYVLLPLLMYPNYQVSSSHDEAFKLSAAVNGIMKLEVSQKVKDHITVYYHEPLSWRSSEIISAISILAILGYIPLYIRKNKNSSSSKHSAHSMNQ